MKAGLQAAQGPIRVDKTRVTAGAGRTRRGFVLIILVFLAVSLVGVDLPVLDAEELIYHGNTESKIFHRPGCQHYNCKKCTAVFDSREKAIDAGYRPCKVCKP